MIFKVQIKSTAAAQSASKGAQSILSALGISHRGSTWVHCERGRRRRKREMQGCLILVVWDWQWRKDNNVWDKPKTYFITPNRRWCCTYDLNCLYNYCNCKFCSRYWYFFYFLDLLYWRSLTVQPNRKHIKGLKDSKTFPFYVKGWSEFSLCPRQQTSEKLGRQRNSLLAFPFSAFCNHHPANTEFQYIQEFVLAISRGT